ncbi:MAG: carboxypeptidase regulatory-like domain-containing protein [Planctomycetota bacterium]
MKTRSPRRWTLATCFLLVAGVLSAGPADAAAQPIVLDPQTIWSEGCGSSHLTELWTVEETDTGSTVFRVLDPGHTVVMNHPASLDLDPKRYPTLSMTYRGKGLRPDNSKPNLLVFFGGEPGNVVAFRSEQAVWDGETHTLTADLQELGAKRLARFDLRLHADDDVDEAWFELIDLRLLPAESGLAEGQDADAPEDSSAAIAVRVTDTAGEPAAGAAVVLDPHLRQGAAKASTDEAGRAEVSPVAVDGGGSMLRVEAPGMAPVWFRQLSALPAGQELAVTLRPATTVAGVVVDESGEPVPNAVGELWVRGVDFENHTGRPTFGVRSQRVITDADGRWSSPPLPDDRNLDVGVRWLHDDYLADRWGGHYSGQLSMAHLRDGTAKSVLVKGVEVVGQVIGKDGQPLAGASIGQGRDRIMSNPPPSTTTDADGRFVFHHTEPGALVLTARAQGHAPAVLQTQASPSMEPIVFQLEEASVFRFRVVDADGNPIPKAHVCPDTWLGFRTINGRVRTDERGEATWYGPPDPVEFDIFATQEYGQNRGVVLGPSGPDGEPHIITLGHPLTLTLKVVDAATGKPLDRFTVVPGIMHQLGERAPHFMRREAETVASEDGTWRHRFSFPYPYRVVRVEADGYAPAATEPIPKDAGMIERRLELTAAEPMAGTLVDAAGEPIVYADVYLCLGSSGLQIHNGKALRTNDLAGMITDVDGRFSFPPQGDAFRIIALHDKGYADIDHEDWVASDDRRFVLEPWATVRGTLRVGDKPVANERVGAWMQWDHQSDPRPPHHQLETSTDDEGRFILDRVPPGVKGGVGRRLQLSQNSWGYDQPEQFTAAAGETIELDLGGQGRPVIGRVAWADDSPHDSPLSNGRSRLFTYVDQQAARELIERLQAELMPEGFKDWTPEEYQAFAQTDEGKQIQKRFMKAQYELQGERRNHNFAIESDGSFRIENVRPGLYQLSVHVAAPPVGNQCGFGEALGQLTHKVEVPPLPDGMAYFAEPLDVGELRVEAMKLSPAIGEPAPTFALPVLPIADANEQANGEEPAELDLATLPTMGSDDLAGKVTLIYFGASWCGPCHAEVPHLTETFEAFGDDPRFGMMTVSLDQTPAAAIAYAEKNDSRWPQLYSAGMFESDVAKGFAVRGIPSVWLIGPDGKVVARNLRGAAILPAVRQHLGSLPAKAAR